jgi:ribosomal protein L39E
MGKKSNLKKQRLGKALKKSRRIPLLAIVRTHRHIQSNNFARNWRRTKLKLDEK